MLNFSDVSYLSIWRYKDPILGPRKIPVVGDHKDKCIALENNSVLKVDVAGNKIELVSNGLSVDVGLQFIYTYEK